MRCVRPLRRDWSDDRTGANALLSKIWDEHRVGIRDDGREIIYMDRNVVHDLHGSHAFAKLEQTNRSVRRPDLTFGVLDHSVATTPGRTDATNPKGLPFAQGMRAGSARFGFRLFDVDDAEQGIAHVIAPEMGLVLPGSTYACPDSHACTVGALGAIAFRAVRASWSTVLATQTVAMHKPKQMRIILDGRSDRRHIEGRHLASDRRARRGRRPRLRGRVRGRRGARSFS